MLVFCGFLGYNFKDMDKILIPSRFILMKKTLFEYYCSIFSNRADLSK